MELKCFFCKGPAHPATGHQYTDNVLCCGPCYREFFPWFLDRVNRNPIGRAATGDYEGVKADMEKRKKLREKRRKGAK